MHFLIYLSLANGDLSEKDLVDILETSRRNNQRDGITGMLLYRKRRFMQLLEGPKEAVLATYERIAADPRHREATKLLEGDSAERDFAEWSMGFNALDDAPVRELPGFSSFLEADFSVFEFASDPSRAHQLLRIFRRT